MRTQSPDTEEAYLSDIFLPPELTGHIYGLDSAALRARGDATSDAIQAALSGGDYSAVLRIPAGYTKIDGVNRVWATVISRPIVMAGRSLQGSLQHSAVPSRIVAANPMAALIQGNSAFDLSDIQLDGGGQSVMGLDANIAHEAHVRRVQAIGCTGTGIQFKDSFARVRNLYVAGNGAGMRFIGCTGMTAEDCVVNANMGLGLEVVGLGSGLTTYAGGVHIKGGTIDGNGRDGISPQAVLNGVEGGSLRDIYVESANAGGPDGIRLRSKCYAITASGIHFVTSGYTVNAEQARGCTFRDCTAPLISGAAPKARVVRDTIAGVDAGYGVEFINCFANSYGDPRYWSVEHWLAGASAWACEARPDGMYAPGPPPGTLRFRTGTRVRKHNGPGAWAQTIWSADGGFQWAAD